MQEIWKAGWQVGRKADKMTCTYVDRFVERQAGRQTGG